MNEKGRQGIKGRDRKGQWGSSRIYLQIFEELLGANAVGASCNGIE